MGSSREFRWIDDRLATKPRSHPGEPRSHGWVDCQPGRLVAGGLRGDPWVRRPARRLCSTPQTAKRPGRRVSLRRVPSPIPSRTRRASRFIAPRREMRRLSRLSFQRRHNTAYLSEQSQSSLYWARRSRLCSLNASPGASEQLARASTLSAALRLYLDRKLVGLRRRRFHRCRGVRDQAPKRSRLAGVIQRALVSVRDDLLG